VNADRPRGAAAAAKPDKPNYLLRLCAGLLSFFVFWIVGYFVVRSLRGSASEAPGTSLPNTAWSTAQREEFLQKDPRGTSLAAIYKEARALEPLWKFEEAKAAWQRAQRRIDELGLGVQLADEKKDLENAIELCDLRIGESAPARKLWQDYKARFDGGERTRALWDAGATLRNPKGSHLVRPPWASTLADCQTAILTVLDGAEQKTTTAFWSELKAIQEKYRLVSASYEEPTWGKGIAALAALEARAPESLRRNVSYEIECCERNAETAVRWLAGEARQRASHGRRAAACTWLKGHREQFVGTKSEAAFDALVAEYSK